MRVALVLLLTCATAHADAAWSCPQMLRALTNEIATSPRRTLPLRRPPAAPAWDEMQVERADCDRSFRALERALRGRPARGVELGTIAGSRVAVLLEGPSGSGHYWDVAIAVERPGAVVGACTVTATTGFRNLHGAPGLRWRPVQPEGLVIWDTVDSPRDLYSSLLIPLVYHLEPERLVLDVRLTREALGRFAAYYDAPAHEGGDRALHDAAARALRAYAAGTACP